VRGTHPLTRDGPDEAAACGAAPGAKSAADAADELEDDADAAAGRLGEATCGMTPEAPEVTILAVRGHVDFFKHMASPRKALMIVRGPLQTTQTWAVAAGGSAAALAAGIPAGGGTPAARCVSTSSHVPSVTLEPHTAPVSIRALQKTPSSSGAGVCFLLREQASSTTRPVQLLPRVT